MKSISRHLASLDSNQSPSATSLQVTQIIPAKSFDFSLNQQDLSEERVLGLLGLPTVGFRIKMVEKSRFWEESALLCIVAR